MSWNNIWVQIAYSTKNKKLWLKKELSDELIQRFREEQEDKAETEDILLEFRISQTRR